MAPRPDNLRIQVTRTNSFSSSIPSPLPQSASPVPGDASWSFLSNQENQTPPSTPPIGAQGFNLLAPGMLGMNRRALLRRNSSVSSISSTVSDEGESDVDWTPQEEEKLRSTFDSYVDSVDHAPFSQNGPPPSNLTHIVARAVISSASTRASRASKRGERAAGLNDITMAEVSEDESRDAEVMKWRHGLKSTRVKILALVKERQTQVEATPKACSDATPKRGAPMIRQGSMDFLPVARNVGIVARLGSKLQRAEQSGPPRSGHRPRLSRTGSLTSIAGSPSQPVKAPTAGPSSSGMSRINSDTTGRNPFMAAFDQHVPAPQSARPSTLNSPLFGLSFDDSAPSSSASTFSFPPSKTPKRANAALASAFNSPSLDCYPTPVSTHKKKAKFTHHSPNNSLDLKGPPPPPLTLDQPFQSPMEPTFGGSIGLGLGGAFSSSPKKPLSRTGGTVGASGSFYLAGEDQAMSNGSISSFDSATTSASSAFFPTTRRDRLTTSSSFSSFASDSDKLGPHSHDESNLKHGTPSPMSSTFDLNDLSLETLEAETDEMATETRSPTGAQDYWEAGHEAQQLRASLQGYGWGQA